MKRREGREGKNRGGSPKCLVKMMEMQYLTSQVLAAATVIAKHTSVLCNACKVASSKTSNPVAKRHFVQAAKEVANSTANLVKNIKVSTSVCVIVCTLSTNSSSFFLPLHLFTLPSPFPSPFLPPLPSPPLLLSLQALAGNLSEENRQACAETTQPLVEAVEALTTFASSPQFASTPAKISAQARLAQTPIIEVGGRVWPVGGD